VARTFVTGLSRSVSALMPLVARDLLHGGAQTLRHHAGRVSAWARGSRAQHRPDPQAVSGEAAVRACALSMGSAIVAVALSRMPVLTAAPWWSRARRGCWRSRCSISACSCRRRVVGRGPVARSVPGSIAGGIAIEAWGWGHLTDAAGR